MNNPSDRTWSELLQDAKHYKQAYPPGTRIVLLQMGKDPHPVPNGTKGTVLHVNAIGTIFCRFDNGRRIGIIPSQDDFRIITDEN